MHLWQKSNAIISLASVYAFVCLSVTQKMSLQFFGPHSAVWFQVCKTYLESLGQAAAHKPIWMSINQYKYIKISRFI